MLGEEEAAELYKPFLINCSLGDHRGHRLNFARDGTQAECLTMSRKSKDIVAQDTLLTQEETKRAHAREKRGERVVYSLPLGVTKNVTSVRGTSTFALGSFDEDRKSDDDLTSHDFSTLQFLFRSTRHEQEHEFFDASRNYVHLSDTFSVATVRSVFPLDELLRIKRTLDESKRCLFMLHSVTAHLAPRKDVFVLCEVDFKRMCIVFYHSASDDWQSLQFYAEAMWNQFVLPNQQNSWKIWLFPLPNTLLATLFIVVFARMGDADVTQELVRTPNIVAQARYALDNLHLEPRR